MDQVILSPNKWKRWIAFTPKRYRFQISPGAPPEILQFTHYEDWLFIALRGRYCTPILTTSLLRISSKGWEDVLFGLWLIQLQNSAREGVLATVNSTHRNLVSQSFIRVVVCCDLERGNARESTPTLWRAALGKQWSGWKIPHIWWTALTLRFLSK